LTQGLFKLEIADHHAVLGVPLDADTKQVRKRYLAIARKLHPDSLRSASEDQKQQAGELLSKFVNPAYETLTQEKSAMEHTVLLKLKGQQLQQQPALLSVSEAQAQGLSSSHNLDHDYSTAVKALATEQYESLDNVMAVIGRLSELNAVYVMRKGGAGAPAAPAVSSPASSTATSDTAAEQPAPAANHPRRRRELVIESYLNRAKEFEYKRAFDRAITELREAVKNYPDSALCHSHLANAYLKAGQSKMASIHCKRALELDANDTVGNEVQKKLDAQAKRTSRSAAPKQSKPKEGGGGLFGGLFGGKKRS
jgi:tetratricopeptide (TPR) repeat protein